MLAKIRDFFDSRIQPGVRLADARQSEQALRLATAALLIETTRADFHVGRDERRTVQELVQRQFGLSRDESEELVSLAEEEADQSVSLYQFTELVDKHFSAEQKVRVIEMLWRVVYADGHKDSHEEHLVRKVADLLHVSHSAFIRTRHQVETELGLV